MMRSQIVECPGACGGTLIVPESGEDLLEAGRTGSEHVFFCSKGCRVTVGYAGRLQATRRTRPVPAPVLPSPAPSTEPRPAADSAITPTH